MCFLTSEREKWKVFMLRGFVTVSIVLLLLGINGGALEPAAITEARVPSIGNNSEAAGDRPAVKRIGPGADACSKDNILIFQDATTPLPSGIPTYTVDIENVCLEGSCSFSNIHLSCGWFSSARLINPQTFRRIAYNDCLVKDGRALNPGETVYFQYANTFKYPLAVSSISCQA